MRDGDVGGASRRGADTARRRHLAGRPGDRRRPRARHLEVPQPRPRDRSGGAHGPRPARRRARRPQRRPQATSPPLRARRVIVQPRHRRRDDRATTRAAPARSSTARPSITSAMLHVVLADGRCGASRVRSSAAELARRRAARTASRAMPIGRSRALAQTHAAEIDRRFPKLLRRVGGYNLDAFVDPAAAGRPLAHHRRLRGHARLRHRSHGRPGAAAQGKGADDGGVRRPARRARRDTAGAAAPARRRRGDGRLHPAAHARERRRSTRSAGPSSSATARRCSASSSMRDHADELPPRLEALERDLRGERRGVPHPRAHRRGRPGDGSGACARPRSGCRWR